MALIIGRNNVDKYIKVRKLGNLKGFLDDVIKNGSSDFLNFVRGDDHSNEMNPKGQPVLLHGSVRIFDVLEIPKSPKNKKSGIYATDNSNYAIFLGIIDIQENGGASVSVSNNKLSITTGFINGQSKISNGYVHIVAKEDFKPTSNAEYISYKPAPVIFSVPVSVDDLTQPIFVAGK